MKWKQVLAIVGISAATTFGSIFAYNKFIAPERYAVGTATGGLPVNYAGFTGNTGNPAETVDLTRAANAAVPAVVHIKTKIPAKKVSNLRRNNEMFDDWFGDFFGGSPNVIPEQRASGSGVLISEDGYIVTNNHVISNGNDGVADEINVTLNNRKSYKARLIGRDPSSDLAVLKIDGNKFPFLIYGNNANLQLGQWVLAIGYPLTLETTVTAGIVSATGRSININRRQSETPVESFIQTDAAVNQGNSGGALVNPSGELIGINSAILAPTGTYAGYSFAIPVNIVKKIVDDIIRFGDVQRGYLGINYIATDDLSDDERKAQGLPTNTDGVLVSGVSPEGGAAAAGIKKGDIITKVNGAAVNSGIQMSAQIANFRPGDKVEVVYLRNNKEVATQVVLKKKGDVITQNIGNRLGAELTTLDKAKARQYGISGGVVVNKITDGGPISRTRMQPGFVIISVNGQEVGSVDALAQLLTAAGGPVRVEGIYPGYDGTYTYPMNLDQ
ncbi:trypsin-like peptidase domain-containing protein [Flaviaesturariibacter amylovorans]|uniref:Do family serine endopeptidase n=1 Tax=Flaviaesturariibacter amylovorans TaxID=1084520 RepID=A0ABP8GIL8_9BACT